MKRGKGENKLRELMDAMKKVPNSFVRSTFIVGHPFETDNDFQELYNYVKEFEFDRINVFSYSDEEGTSAFNLEDKIEQNIIDKRAEILGNLISTITIEKLKNEIGTTCKIIVDGESDEHEYLLSARKLLWAPNIDGEIYINDNELNENIKFGQIYTAKITQIVGDKLLATIIN
jgi:tRNA A37 methylthiotransferase MiaB